MPAIIVSETAVDFSLYGESLYIVNNIEGNINISTDISPADINQGDLPTGEVHRTFVRTGQRRDGNVVVLEGLKAGDIVVDSGQLKLSNGNTIESCLSILQLISSWIGRGVL